MQTLLIIGDIKLSNDLLIQQLQARGLSPKIHHASDLQSAQTHWATTDYSAVIIDAATAAQHLTLLSVIDASQKLIVIVEQLPHQHSFIAPQCLVCLPHAELLSQVINQLLTNHRQNDQLQRLRTQLRDYDSLASEWFWELDSELHYVQVSPRFFARSGYTAADIIGKKRGGNLSANNAASNREHQQELEQHRAFNNRLLYLPTPRGELMAIESSGVPIFSAHNEFLGYHGVSRDVSTQHQAMLTRELHARRFEDFADLAADWFWETDAQMQYTYLSQRYEHLTGTPVSEMLGRPRRQAFDLYASDETDWRSHFELIEQQRAFEVEFVWRSDSGVRRHVLSIGRPVFNADNQLIGYRGIGKDLTEQRKAERALRESEQLMRVIADHCPLEIALKDKDGRYLYVNRYAESICGIPIGQYIGRLPQEVYEPELAQKIHEHDQEVLASGKVIEKHEKIFCNDHEYWQWSIKFPTRNEVGDITGLGTVVMDYTQQAEAQEALRKSEEHFRNLIEGSLQGILIHDGKQVLFMNQATVDIFGLGSIQDGIQIDPMSIIAPYERRRICEYTERRFAGDNAPPHYELDGLRQDGTIVHLQLSVRSIEINNAPAIQATIIDISELRQAERALLKEMHLNHLVLQSAQDAFCIIDMQSQIRDLNDSYLHMLGYSRSEVIDTSISHYEAGGRYTRFMRRHAHILETGSDRFETCYQHKDGHLVDVEVSVTLAEQEGEHFFFCFIRDISDRKLAETKLREYQDHLEELVSERTLELQKAVQEQEAFSYSVSHDLRAPLRAIDGFCKILMDDCGADLPVNAQSYLQRVRAASQRMGTLIDALLDLSRMSRRRVQVQDVDISALADNVAQLLQGQQTQRQINIHIQAGLQARGDSNLLRIVLENLLGNAWKYTGQTTHPVIEFGGEQREDEQVFWVKDNGVGFNMKYVHKLFGAFQRLHAMNEFEGTGIGLATVARIIERHGGRVWAEAELDKGASFYFALPRTANLRIGNPSKLVDSSETTE